MVVMARRTAIRDGVRLRYLDSGVGSPPLLFIDGWSCSAWFWREQIAAFEDKHPARGGLDLHGHGESDKPNQDYTIAAFADDVAWLCRQVRLERPVVVGHSMGGMIALRLALDRPELAAAIVIVDSPIVPFADPLASQMGQIVARLASPAYNAHDTSARYGFRLQGPYGGIPALPAGEVPVPALFVAASETPWSLEAIKACFPNMRTAQVVAAGHFLQLEVPEQFNAMLRRFLEVARVEWGRSGKRTDCQSQQEVARER
jgi:pimeloyl-ACP methyl ester carboxylesterase